MQIEPIRGDEIILRLVGSKREESGGERYAVAGGSSGRSKWSDRM